MFGMNLFVPCNKSVLGIAIVECITLLVMGCKI